MVVAEAGFLGKGAHVCHSISDIRKSLINLANAEGQLCSCEHNPNGALGQRKSLASSQEGHKHAVKHVYVSSGTCRLYLASDSTSMRLNLASAVVC